MKKRLSHYDIYLVREKNKYNETVILLFSNPHIMLKLGLPDFICQRQSNARENVNGLESSDPEPESDGSTDSGKQLAEGRPFHLGYCHLHHFGERQDDVAFLSSGSL